MTPLVVRSIFPVALVVCAAMLAKGYAHVGDGFAGGAAAGLGAFLLYMGLEHEDAARVAGARWAWRLIGVGLTLTLLVALVPVLAGSSPVRHVPLPGADVVKVGVLELHSAVLFDLGIALLVYGALVATFDHLFPHLPEETE